MGKGDFMRNKAEIDAAFLKIDFDEVAEVYLLIGDEQGPFKLFLFFKLFILGCLISKFKLTNCCSIKTKMSTVMVVGSAAVIGSRPAAPGINSRVNSRSVAGFLRKRQQVAARTLVRPVDRKLTCKCSEVIFQA